MSEDRITALRRTTNDALDLCLRWRREDFLPSAVGSAARTALGQAAVAMVLGLDDRTGEVVDRARAWLADSEARDEQMGDDPRYFAMVRAQSRGLAAWMLDEGGAARRLADAVRFHQQVRSEPQLPDLVRDSVLAGRPALGAAVYHRLVGPAPAGPREVTGPPELAGWLAHELSSLRPPPDWVSVGERVLQDRLLDWVDRGHGVTAALWLWLVLGESGAARSAAEAMRRGGEVIGARPEDPLARVLRESLGDPVDVDLFAGFLSAVAVAALPIGATLTAELVDLPPLIAVAEEADVAAGLDLAVRAALPAYDAPLEERLASAVRGRLVAPDGETPLVLERVLVS